MEIVKIGRREIDKEVFIQAVANNKSLTHIIEAIGLNPIPTSTRWDVTAKIEELELNTTHLKAKNKVNVEAYQSRVKTFKLSNSNQNYLDKFLGSLQERSQATYKATCGNFLQAIGTNDFIKISPKRIVEFASHKNTESMRNNVTAHLRSMMIYCVNNDIKGSDNVGAVERVSKEMLIWLISK